MVIEMQTQNENCCMIALIRGAWNMSCRQRLTGRAKGQGMRALELLLLGCGVSVLQKETVPEMGVRMVAQVRGCSCHHLTVYLTVDKMEN